jgi:hypothetical protein
MTSSATKMYYVMGHACKDLEDAEETQWLYRCAGIAADILTEAEYFAILDSNGILLH